MKIKYTLLTAVLTIALTLPLLGQGARNDTTKTNLNQPDPTSIMGKPTADATVGGLHMKVWLMTQVQHKEIMNEKMGQMPMPAAKEGGMAKVDSRGLNDTSLAMGKDTKDVHHDSLEVKAATTRMGNDTVDAIQGSRSMTKATTDSMMAGTHHIVLDVTEIASGKEVAGASARVLIESPTKKSSSVDLKSMMSHFDSALTLDEKGEYRFTVNVNFGGVTKTTQFQYAVK
jgi:hypothetical protein